MTLDRLIRLFAVAVFVNFFAFCVEALSIGGDAINGYVKAGRYFLCLYGTCHQVGATLFEYSWWHALSVIGSFANLLLLTLVQKWRGKDRHKEKMQS